MTLVPIIYTSLLIFSALLLFVIIVSYISFKLKPQRKPETVHANYQRAININRVDHSAQIPQQIKPRPIIIKQEKSYGNISPQKVYAENDFHIRNTNSRNTRRLEIMNTSEYFQNLPKERYEPKYDRRKDSLIITDSNIFDFYADKSNSNFSSASSF